tara:strand:- start:640 stop:804 length:165 start_codon:yes stop_codon:yes gene_type:complete
MDSRERPAQLKLSSIHKKAIGNNRFYETQPVNYAQVKGDVVIKKNYPYRYRYGR